MDEKLKLIIARHTKLTVDEVTDETIINRSAMGSSIHVHRFYSELAKEGYSFINYQDIDTVSHLLQQISGKASNGAEQLQKQADVHRVSFENNQQGASVGIDIENIEAFPVTDDFREHSFYTSNFAASEIAYCILQPNPYASFAGLFAAKEALIKANNNLQGKQFNLLVFEHSQTGKPQYPGYAVSISHTDSVAIAAVIAVNNTQMQGAQAAPQVVSGRRTEMLISLLALLLSLVAVILYFKK
jgi:phosphopantetheinyl transferase (holo-ACP synthase)